MICCVVVFEGPVTGVVHGDSKTHQCLLESCVKFSQTAVVVLKDSSRNLEKIAEIGKLIFRAYQGDMELDYIAVSRLFLVPVAKGL